MNVRGFANAMISACTEFLGRTSRNQASHDLNPAERVQGFQYPWVRSAISVGRDRASMVLSAQEVCPTKFRHRRGHFLRKRQWNGCGGKAGIILLETPTKSCRSSRLRDEGKPLGSD